MAATEPRPWSPTNNLIDLKKSNRYSINHNEQVLDTSVQNASEEQDDDRTMILVSSQKEGETQAPTN